MTALRNYSKAQTAARVGSLTSPSQLSLTHSLKSAGVQKPRPRPMRRQSLGSAPSSPLASPLRRLSLSTPRRRPSRVELSEGEEEEEEPGLDESWEYAGNQAGVAAPSSQGLGRVPRWGSGAKLHPAALLPGALDAYSTRSRHSCPQGMHPAAAPLAAPAVPAVVSPFQDSAMVKLPSLNVGGRDACTVPVEELDSVDLNSMLNHLVGEDLVREQGLEMTQCPRKRHERCVTMPLAIKFGVIALSSGHHFKLNHAITNILKHVPIFPVAVADV